MLPANSPETAPMIHSDLNNKHVFISGRICKKSKPVKEVIVHHPIAIPQAEDWILFPEDIIITRNSSIRRSRIPKVEAGRRGEKLGRQRAQQSMIAKEQPAAEGTSGCQLESRSPFSHSESMKEKPAQIQIRKESLFQDARNPPDLKLPCKFPTPDLSDLEEDSFWSCCQSSEDGAQSGESLAVKNSGI